MKQEVHRVDSHTIKLESQTDDKWRLKLNGRKINEGFGGMKKGHLRLVELVDALTAEGYNYQEYIDDRGDERSESESRYALIREDSGGGLDAIDYSDDKSELVEQVLKE